MKTEEFVILPYKLVRHSSWTVAENIRAQRERKGLCYFIIPSKSSSQSINIFLRGFPKLQLFPEGLGGGSDDVCSIGADLRLL